MSARDVDVRERAETPPAEESLGELFGRLSTDLSTLFRKEVELAKVEVKAEVTKAGKGAGMLGAGALAGYLALVMASFAAAWGLAVVMPRGFAFLAVACLYGLAALVMLATGRKKVSEVHAPQQTIETVEEDVQWARARIS